MKHYKKITNKERIKKKRKNQVQAPQIQINLMKTRKIVRKRIRVSAVAFANVLNTYSV